MDMEKWINFGNKLEKYNMRDILKLCFLEIRHINRREQGRNNVGTDICVVQYLWYELIILLCCHLQNKINVFVFFFLLNISRTLSNISNLLVFLFTPLTRYPALIPPKSASTMLNLYLNTWPSSTKQIPPFYPISSPSITLDPQKYINNSLLLSGISLPAHPPLHRISISIYT